MGSLRPTLSGERPSGRVGPSKLGRKNRRGRGYWCRVLRLWRRANNVGLSPPLPHPNSSRCPEHPARTTAFPRAKLKDRMRPVRAETPRRDIPWFSNLYRGLTLTSAEVARGAADGAVVKNPDGPQPAPLIRHPP